MNEQRLYLANIIITATKLTDDATWPTLPGMDSETVRAQRENGRIGAFVQMMVEQGRLTPFEQELIRQESQELFRQAGYLDSGNRLSADIDDESRAVLRQANHRQRQKLIALHPELAAELVQAIARRNHHATPVLTPLLKQPGVALARYLDLLDFVMAQRDGGAISRDEAYAAYEPAIRLFEDEGISMDGLSNQTDKIVLLKAHHAVRAKLLEIRPEFAAEIRNLEAGRSK